MKQRKRTNADTAQCTRLENGNKREKSMAEKRTRRSIEKTGAHHHCCRRSMSSCCGRKALATSHRPLLLSRQERKLLAIKMRQHWKCMFYSMPRTFGSCVLRSLHLNLNRRQQNKWHFNWIESIDSENNKIKKN